MRDNHKIALIQEYDPFITREVLTELNNAGSKLERLAAQVKQVKACSLKNALIVDGITQQAVFLLFCLPETEKSTLVLELVYKSQEMVQAIIEVLQEGSSEALQSAYSDMLDTMAYALELMKSAE